MKEYKFILKPFFFILNLLFACWLVMEIEKITPSSFGAYSSVFEPRKEAPAIPAGPDKVKIRLLMEDYKKGFIDSTKAADKLDKLFQPRQ